MPISPKNRREVTPSPLTADAALGVLRRHQVRRRQRIPTVTVLAGRDDAPGRVVRRVGELEKRSVREVASIEPEQAVVCWFEALVQSQDVVGAAYAWLAGRASSDVQKLTLELPSRSPYERALFLDRALGTKTVPPVDAVCRAVVEHACQNGSTVRDLWQRLFDACGGDLFRATAGIFALVGEERTPLLHVVARPGDVVLLRTVVAKVASLVSAAPSLSIVVSTNPERLEEYLVTTPECHALALVREGLIWLADGSDPADWDDARAAHDANGSAASRHAADTDAPSAAAAHPNQGVAPSREEDERARSAAERYLYERLQAHPETAGLFELNGSLAVPGVNRVLEVDLLAHGVRVAIEIDGYYHFTDRDAYRRDRYKDLLLQQAGFFVIRCLAEDVASRLEEILAWVVAAVQRTMLGAGQGSMPARSES
ncbi:MAG TPA: DUF559 domain-containing protein [Pirellulales bacterium]|nr:DUF559 domain-containing protein [Pirellulales bacterium]